MGFLKKVAQIGGPVIGGVAGGAIAGPGGAAVGSTIGSGISNYISGQDAYEQQLAMQNAQLAHNERLQKEFAQNGIRWKVEDAKAAGIHPLYALGASTTSFSPISVSGPVDNSSANLASMGQDIFRSVMANTTKDERQEKMAHLQLENQELQNMMLASQIAKMNANPTPGLPSNSGLGALTNSGQGDAYVLEQPLTRTHSAKGAPHQEVGAVPDVGYAQTETGMAPVPSGDVKQRIEDQMIPELMWSVRNNLVPTISGGSMGKPSRDLLEKRYPGAHDWSWSTFKQEWQPYYKKNYKKPTYKPRTGLRH